MRDVMEYLNELSSENLDTDIGRLDFIVSCIVEQYQQHYAFKGGYALTNMLGEPRLTKDVDLSIGCVRDYDELLEILKNIGEFLISMGVIDSYKSKDIISEGTSGGIEYIKANRKILGVDVGLHDIHTGVRTLIFRCGEVQVFSPERMLAAKISSMLSKRRFRRVKDMYDVYVLCGQFKLSYAELHKLLCLRMRGHEDDWDNIPFNDEVIEQLGIAYEKSVLTNIFTSKKLVKPDFKVVIDNFYELTTALKYNVAMIEWDIGRRTWL